MIGERKPFSRAAYDECDGPAKWAVATHLHHSHHKVEVPPESYGVDMCSNLGPIIFYHEVEVFKNWTQGNFPFTTGSIPGRKIRLRGSIPYDCPLYFWRLRFDLARALVFSSKWMIDKFLVEVPNKEIADGEFFYRVPVVYGKEFDLLPTEEVHYSENTDG